MADEWDDDGQQLDPDLLHWIPVPDDGALRLMYGKRTILEVTPELSTRLRAEQRQAQREAEWHMRYRPTHRNRGEAS